MSPNVAPRIPVLDLAPEIQELGEELWTTLRRVVASGHFILGPEVQAFEKEAAAYLGVEHAVGLNSGTDALVIGLRAMGVGAGDEVVTTPFTFFATAEAILAVGAKPVFVDIDPRTYNLDASLLAKAMTPRTKCILPVHLFGLACDMDAIRDAARDQGIAILEDTAQAMGATFKGQRLGAIGDVGAFSFFPSKTLGAFGDGGLLTTNDAKTARAARMLRAHGSERKYHNEVVGYNSRLDEVQAAVLRLKLRRLEAWNERRRHVAERYQRVLQDLPGIVLPSVGKDGTHVFHQYTIRCTGIPRDALAQGLAAAGIGTMVYYPTPLHKLPALGPRDESHPRAEQAAGQVLSLPMGHSLPAEHQDEVARAVRGLVAQRPTVRGSPR